MRLAKAQNSADRLYLLDFARALGMLWIVGIWHLPKYCSFSPDFGAAGDSFTMGVMAVFTFISAYLLGKKRISGRRDVLAFYKARLLRTYIPFFISAVSLYVLNLVNARINYVSSARQLIATLLGAAMLFPPAPYTVWFYSMMILFYAITPFFNWLPSVKSRLLAMLGFLAALFLLSLAHEIDYRLPCLSIAYFCGLLAAPKPLILERLPLRKNLMLIAASTAGFFGVVALYPIARRLFLPTLYFGTASVFCVVFFLALGAVWERLAAPGSLLRKPFSFLSSVSLMAYLFHRHFFGLLWLVFGEFSAWTAYLIALPLLLLFSSALQALYDRLLGALARKG